MPEPRAGQTPLERAWSDTTVETESPNGRIRVTMVGDHELRLWVDPTWYAAVPVRTLQDELVKVARLVYVNRTRAYYDTWSRLAGRLVRPSRTPASPETEEYQRRLDEVVARGEAYDGRIALVLSGTSRFTVSIDPSVVRDLDAPAFCARAREAALACLREHEEGWQRAHFDVYTRPRLERAGVL